MDVVDRVAEALRSRGERMTGPRRAVVETLAANPGHLTAEQVADALPQGGAHRASVYRNLEVLIGLGVVQHVHLGHGATAYHLVTEHGPHLHAQCRSCGKVIDVDPHLLDDAAARLRTEHGFALEAEHVALSGTCADCAERDREHGHGHGHS